MKIFSSSIERDAASATASAITLRCHFDTPLLPLIIFAGWFSTPPLRLRFSPLPLLPCRHFDTLIRSIFSPGFQFSPAMPAAFFTRLMPPALSTARVHADASFAFTPLMPLLFLFFDAVASA
jgi:hypothetical protein